MSLTAAKMRDQNASSTPSPAARDLNSRGMCLTGKWWWRRRRRTQDCTAQPRHEMRAGFSPARPALRMCDPNGERYRQIVSKFRSRRFDPHLYWPCIHVRIILLCGRCFYVQAAALKYSKFGTVPSKLQLNFYNCQSSTKVKL